MTKLVEKQRRVPFDRLTLIFRILFLLLFICFVAIFFVLMKETLSMSQRAYVFVPPSTKSKDFGLGSRVLQDCSLQKPCSLKPGESSDLPKGGSDGKPR